jgi:hypothetical protein
MTDLIVAPPVEEPEARPGPLGVIGAAAAVLACLAGLIGGWTVDSEQVDGLGLLRALPPIYWVGVALAAVATFALLSRAVAGSNRLVWLVPTAWLLVLHGGPHLAHEHTRFPTNWVHLGFVRLIGETGRGDVFIDARFAWPGFFGVFVAPMADADPVVVEWMMRLWPLIILTVSGVLVGTLAARAYPTKPGIEPVAVTTYFFLAWTGQDYWSPQSFGFLVYLSVLVLVESGPLRTSPAWSASVPFLARFASGGGERPRSRDRGIFTALALFGIAAVVSHPLAPFFICAGLLMLAVYGRGVGWRLILIVAVSFVIWFIVHAQPWYATQLPRMVDEIGSLFSNLDETTSARVATSSPDHLFVSRIRSIMGVSTILAVLIIGVTMAFDRFKALRPVIPLAPLAGAPSLALALGSYGGEIIFRVILFTLPMAAILLARVLLEMPPRTLPLSATTLALAMTTPLLLARFGNEAFEMVTDVDREVAAVAVERAEADTFFVLDNAFAAFADETRGANEGTALLVEGNQQWVDGVFELADATDRDRVIVVVTPSMRAWRTHGLSIPPQELDTALSWLKQRADSEVLYENEGGVVLELRSPESTVGPSDEEG